MNKEALEAVEDRLEHLTVLAQSDLPAAWIAQELLRATDDSGGGETP